MAPTEAAGRPLSLKEALAWREDLRLLGLRLVFTNGVFDLIHAGHASYLAEARARGDALLVGLNSDASARGLGKGTDRPLVPQEDRALVLLALRSVDAVVLFDEPTPLSLILTLTPDVLAKGADYEIAQIVGAPEVLGWGGRVERIPLLPGRSTTALVERIRRSAQEDG